MTRSSVRVLVAAPLAVVLVLWWQSNDRALEFPDLSAQAVPAMPRVVLTFGFFGDTPSLAWAPDSQHLAFNSAFGAYPGGHGSGLGLWVYDRSSEATTQLVREPRYHPAFLGNETIATACSPYEDCTEGLYLTQLSGANQHALTSSVYHTVAGSGGDDDLLFFEGFRGYTGWNQYDTTTAARHAGVAPGCSWEPPASLVQDQCVQQVGSVSVAVDTTRGLWVRVGEADPFLADEGSGYWYSGSPWDCIGNHAGVVDPCLSPDGRQVAWVAQAEGQLQLRVVELPTLAGLTAFGPAGDPSAVPLFSGDVPVGVPDPATAPLAMAPDDPQPMTRTMTTETSTDPARAYLALDLFGDSPSLAWSPEGERLVVSATNHYLETPTNQGGLFVIDPAAGTAQRLTSEERRHPVWTSAATIVSSCGFFSTCSPGLIAMDLEANRAQQVVDTQAVHVAASQSGGLVFHDPMSYTWREWSAADGIVESSEQGCAWEPPPSTTLDQCVQQVGDVRVWSQAPTGLYAQVGAGRPMRLDPRSPYFFELGYSDGCREQIHQGVVQPCLSPDGSRVAYITRGAVGLSLHVHDIPR